MKIGRLWQPHRPIFWLMLAFNALSSACAWAMRALPLNTVALLLLAFVALLNVGFGLAAAWALLRAPAPGEPDATAAGNRSCG
ncbi:MAG: hypothetical protein C0505_12690 [Leptothrix sp. (in: Bacteria)]|nr:hypothetical protein [Leptothrix sp. (in: b-proteobacteria)]